MSEYIHKSHNVSVLLYHFVCPAKYWWVVFKESVDSSLKEICVEISKRYDIIFIKIGTDSDHVHFSIQSVPVESSTKIIRTVKSIAAKEVFKRHPQVKDKLWGGEFWSKGFYVNTVGKHGNDNTIQAYVKEQGRKKEYKQPHQQPLRLFWVCICINIWWALPRGSLLFFATDVYLLQPSSLACQVLAFINIQCKKCRNKNKHNKLFSFGYNFANAEVMLWHSKTYDYLIVI